MGFLPGFLFLKKKSLKKKKSFRRAVRAHVCGCVWRPEEDVRLHQSLPTFCFVCFSERDRVSSTGLQFAGSHVSVRNLNPGPQASSARALLTEPWSYFKKKCCCNHMQISVQILKPNKLRGPVNYLGCFCHVQLKIIVSSVTYEEGTLSLWLLAPWGSLSCQIHEALPVSLLSPSLHVPCISADDNV